MNKKYSGKIAFCNKLSWLLHSKIVHKLQVGILHFLCHIQQMCQGKQTYTSMLKHNIKILFYYMFIS